MRRPADGKSALLARVAARVEDASACMLSCIGWGGRTFLPTRPGYHGHFADSAARLGKRAWHAAQLYRALESDELTPAAAEELYRLDLAGHWRPPSE